MSGGAHCVLAPPAARPAHHTNYDYINNKTHLCSDLHKIIKQTHSYNHLRYTGELFHSPVAQPVIDKTLHQSETVVRIQRHHDSAMGPPLHDITEGGFCLQNKRVLFFFTCWESVSQSDRSGSVVPAAGAVLLSLMLPR